MSSIRFWRMGQKWTKAVAWGRQLLGWFWKVLCSACNAFRKMFDGVRAPHWMSRCPDSVPTVLIAVSGVIGLFTSLFGSTAAKVEVFIIAAALVILATLISVARNSLARHLNQKKDNWIDQAEHEFREDRRHLLSDQLHNLVQLVADAVATPQPTERHVQATVARTAIIAGAANMVGLKVEKGTRANLFRLSRDKSEMKLEPGGFSGRGDRSDRTFRSGDKTFDATMRNVYRLSAPSKILNPRPTCLMRLSSPTPSRSTGTEYTASSLLTAYTKAS